MKLQPESKKELLRITCGTAVCTAAMWVIFAALHLVGWVKFDDTVVLGGLVGAAVAVANFAGICFVVQKILDEPDEKRRKAKLQLSHNSRMLMQAVWVIVVFVLIMYYKIKTNGILAYLKGLLDPIFLMAPINVLSEISTPVSMAFRHFGNILSGTVISTLLYWALASLSHVVFGWLPGFLSQLQLFQIGIPAFTGLYFDWFGGCIQAFIFCTLTTIFIKRAAGED